MNKVISANSILGSFLLFTLASLSFVTEAKKQSVIDSTNRRVQGQTPNYLAKYSGTYVIKVDGDRSGNDEVLELHSNGNCTWVFSGQKKYGTWKGSRGLIQTIVRGNTGDLPEDFQFRNGKFVSTESNTRYLVKRK